MVKGPEENKNLGSHISVWEKLGKEGSGKIRNDDGENKKRKMSSICDNKEDQAFELPLQKKKRRNNHQLNSLG